MDQKVGNAQSVKDAVDFIKDTIHPHSIQNMRKTNEKDEKEIEKEEEYLDDFKNFKSIEELNENQHTSLRLNKNNKSESPKFMTEEEI